VLAAMVVEDVHERATHLEWRAQNARVVAIGEDRAPPLKSSIQPAREAYGEPLQRARKRALPVRLDDEMQMVRLHRKLRQPRPETLFG
jgi:hypothetical protein